MPTFTVERIRDKPMLTGRCVDNSAAIPIIDFAAKCPSELPQLLYFQIKPTANFAFVVGKAYAELPDQANKPKPTEWVWGREFTGTESITMAGYDNSDTVWFNLQLVDKNKLDQFGQYKVVTLDPKIKNGGGTAISIEPFWLALGALALALFMFGAGRYFGLSSALKKRG